MGTGVLRGIKVSVEYRRQYVVFGGGRLQSHNRNLKRALREYERKRTSPKSIPLDLYIETEQEERATHIYYSAA